MKRTNLVLNEHLLRTATQLLGTKTYSEAVNRALEESIRLVRMRGILEHVGKNIWEGNLSKMREDKPMRRKRS